MLFLFIIHFNIVDETQFNNFISFFLREVNEIIGGPPILNRNVIHKN